MALNRKRKILIGLGIVLLTGVLAILASPLWVPWLMRPVAAKYGVAFASYDRQGYSRLSLRDVHYARGKADFSARTVEILQPIVWLWKHYVSEDAAKEFARVSDWTLEFTRGGSETNRSRSPAQLIGKTRRALAAIQNWIPQAACTNGVVIIKGEPFGVPSLNWNAGEVRAFVVSEKYKQHAEIEMTLASRPERIVISSSTARTVLDLTIGDDPHVLRIEGTGAWHSNQVQIAAEFADAWIPSRATATSKLFVLPADQLRLEGYADPTGTFAAQWDGRRFAIDLQADAAPEQASQLPPIQVDLHASGDTNSVRFDKALISTPWLKARLSTGVEFDYTGKLRSPEAALFVEADLSRQDFIDATGQFTGEAFLQRSEKRYPYARFQLSSESFAGFGMRLRGLDIAGTLDWPRVTLTSAELRFAEGGIGRAEAQMNILARVFDRGHMELRGPIGHEFLPADLSYTNLNATLNFSGPFRKPAYDGRISVEQLSLPAMQPLTITATWAGSARVLDKVEVEANARRSALKLGGAALILTNGVTLDLKQLSLRGTNNLQLQLQRPASIQVIKRNVDFGRVELRDKTRFLALSGNVAWPMQGTLEITATNFLSTEFQDFFLSPLPEVAIDRLAFAGSWTNGPLDFTLQTAGEFYPVETNALSVTATATGDASGLSFEKLTVLSGNEPVVNGRGFLPVRIMPGAETNHFRIDVQQPIDIRLETAPNTAFWNRIATWTGVRFTEPDVNAVVSGTLEDPKGRIIANIARAEWVKSTNNLPTIENVKADIDLSEHAVRMRELKLFLEGEPFIAHAELPLDDLSQNWRKVFDWRKASGRLFAKNIQLAPFVKYMPDILAPQGDLNLDIAFEPGMLLDGFLVVSNAATRPLPSSGALHDLQARLRFTNHIVEFQDVRGLIGGQPIGIFGKVDFSETHRNLPLMDLSLLGDGVPLARRPETILRGDLKLKLSNLTNDIPIVSGEVRLRDSFYLGDIKQLIPGRVISPKRRPPYFSVDAQPMNEWQVNVRVVGENFLNVRSPLFHGVVSANWRITGPLGEPVALGDAEIESGLVKFPFANFRVTRGLMTLTSEDPYRPEIFATATSRAFGYDLQMELSGSANQPIVEFSSTPALTSEQIIAMVTTGEVPHRTFGYSEQQRAQRLALFLGRGLLSRFSDPAGAERLTISTGEEISEEGRETYGLEYKITDNWSIVGEYDRFGAVNAGVKWRIYSK